MNNLDNNQEYRKVGAVAKAHGIRGEFQVFLESDFPDWVAEQKRLFAEVNGEIVAWSVISSRLRQKKLIISVDAITDRNQAEAAAGTPLFVTEEEARQAVKDPDYFYNSDLVGLSMIRDLEDEPCGEVIAVVEMPGRNLLEVKRPNNKTFLFPFTKPLIKEISLEEGVIRVHMPDGLMEANEEASHGSAGTDGSDSAATGD